MRYYLDSGVGAIATAVHTTQFEIRDPEYNLYETVLTTVVDEIAAYEERTGRTVGRIAGVCGKLDQAVREATLAKRLGYDAVLLSPGGLKDLSEDEMIERTRAVAEVMPVIGFYLQEKAGGRYLSYDYWSRLAAIEGVIAIKCAPFDRYRTLDVVRAVLTSPRKDEIALYTGNDDNIVLDLITTYEFDDGKGGKVRGGFIGGLLGHWTLWTKRVVELFDTLKTARESGVITPELLTLAAEITDCNAAFFDPKNNFSGCISGVHEVLRRQGLLKGIWCLNPEEKLSEGQAEEITRVHDSYPHLNDDDFVRENIEKWRNQ
jgi:hypothetical protein